MLPQRLAKKGGSAIGLPTHFRWTEAVNWKTESDSSIQEAKDWKKQGGRCSQQERESKQPRQSLNSKRRRVQFPSARWSSPLQAQGIPRKAPATGTLRFRLGVCAAGGIDKALANAGLKR